MSGFFPTCLWIWFISNRPGYLRQYRDWLRAGGSWDRIPVGAKFYAPVLTHPEAHPDSYVMGTLALPWVKRPRGGVDHPPHIAPRLKEGLSQTSTSTVCLHERSQRKFQLEVYKTKHHFSENWIVTESRRCWKKNNWPNWVLLGLQEVTSSPTGRPRIKHVGNTVEAAYYDHFGTRAFW